MKIRTGFVSNSSSSSFLIVGVENGHKIAELIAKDTFSDEGGQGVTFSDNFTYTGNIPEDCFGEDGKIKVDADGEMIIPEYGLDIYQAGLDVDGRLEKEHFTTLKKEFIEKAKKLGVEIDPDKVKLLYGESSSE